MVKTASRVTKPRGRGGRRPMDGKQPGVRVAGVLTLAERAALRARMAKIGQRSESAAIREAVRRWLGLAVLAAAILGGCAVIAPAPWPERVDLYDARSRRAGHAIIAPDSGRVDFFDARSRRVGAGVAR